jgi:hypothetical protein
VHAAVFAVHRGVPVPDSTGNAVTVSLTKKTAPPAFVVFKIAVRGKHMSEVASVGKEYEQDEEWEGKEAVSEFAQCSEWVEGTWRVAESRSMTPVAIGFAE